MIVGPGRRFVPGVTTGICRRPDDRPRAETHPPNASMNVCLVNSDVIFGVLALSLCLFSYPVSLMTPPGLPEFISSEVVSLCSVPPLMRLQNYSRR
jgi:hypothetical protein